MFTIVQHALIKAAGRHVQLTVDVHNKLEAWCNLISNLDRRPAHLQELQNFPQTWMGTTDASGSGMGVVCQYLEFQYYI